MPLMVIPLTGVTTKAGAEGTVGEGWLHAVNVTAMRIGANDSARRCPGIPRQYRSPALGLQLCTDVPPRVAATSRSPILSVSLGFADVVRLIA